MSQHIIAINYSNKNEFQAEYKCPCCNEIHTVRDIKEFNHGDICFAERFCQDRHFVIWMAFDGKILCARKWCTVCHGTGNEVLFQVPGPCTNCDRVKIPLATLENWYLQNVG